MTPAPALEYDLFPYSQSTRRQLRFLYKLRFKSVRYREETIYDKTSETLWGESLSATLDVKEKWGSITTTLSGSNYFPNVRKFRMDLFGTVQFNLFKGFNAYVAGGGSHVHDQLSLRKREATTEEILLRSREFPSHYDYFVAVGISFTFGSIYTNVVNPRFGRIGGGGVRIVMN